MGTITDSWPIHSVHTHTRTLMDCKHQTQISFWRFIGLIPSRIQTRTQALTGTNTHLCLHISNLVKHTQLAFKNIAFWAHCANDNTIGRLLDCVCDCTVSVCHYVGMYESEEQRLNIVPSMRLSLINGQFTTWIPFTLLCWHPALPSPWKNSSHTLVFGYFHRTEIKGGLKTAYSIDIVEKLKIIS